MDKFEQIVKDSSFSVCILANLHTSDFELEDLSGPLPEDRRRNLSERGMCFTGVIGIIEGVPRVALNEPLDAHILVALAQAFVQRVEDRFNGILEPKGDGVEFLEHLYMLPDTREN